MSRRHDSSSDLSSVEENLELGAYILKDETVVQENLDFVYDLFPRLKERRQQLGGTFSGGEQQMLAIGRGLMSNPETPHARRTFLGAHAKTGG